MQNNNRRIITVALLNSYISGVFRMEDMLHDVYVVGEVSGCSQKNNILYFTLKDSGGQIPVVCFGAGNFYLPQDGEKVIVKGSVEYYSAGGKMNFNAFSIEPEGQGEIYAKMLQIKEKLEKEGLFDPSRKKSLPYLLHNVCIITSLSGAVIQDILQTVMPEVKQIRLTAVDARMQGDNSVASIIKALKIADSRSFDAIIIARGGGSFEDLSTFNDESLIRAIGECKTPIISAVGHETDYTLCDLVSDVRALTPTAAAELLVDCWKTVSREINHLQGRLATVLKQRVYLWEEGLAQSRNSLRRAFFDIYNKKDAELKILDAKLRARDPSKLLKSGYSIAEKNSVRVNSLQDIKNGDMLNLYFSDGKILVKVVEKGDRNGF